MDKGLFLVLEGSDGSGKGTQFKLLVDRLKKEGYDVETFDFPQYNQESSYFVREYLKGTYGTADEVGPYTGSLFYALDRYQAAPDIKRAIEAGKIVIANRFTGSNMAHQGTKFSNTEERKGYFLWLDAIEFQMLGIPRPDLSLVLRVPAKTAQALIDQRNIDTGDTNKHDIHEADLKHLEKAVEVYDNLCELFPKDFKQLDCIRNKKLLDIESIHNLVWQSINPMLPPKRKSKATKTTPTSDAKFDEKRPDGTYKYYVPSNLDKKTATQYREIMDTIFQTYTDIVGKMSKTVTRAQACDAAQAILPVAASSTIEILHAKKTQTSLVRKLAESNFTENYSAEVEAVTLDSVWPRNELEIVPDMLYQFSALPLADIKSAVGSWSYDQKAKTFDSYVTDKPNGPVFEKVNYTWDVVSEYGAFHELHKQQVGDDLEWQELTPRYGYAMPILAEETLLTDDFEQCFDLSLKLYSILQSAGYAHEAQYATLFGHRMRWKVTLTAREMLGIRKLSAHPDYRKLIIHMNEKIAETHPQVARTLLSDELLAKS